MQKNRIKNTFMWVPLHERKNRKNPGSIKPLRIGELEHRKPLLWLHRKRLENSHDGLYLINDSGKPINEIVTNNGGFVSFDDGITSISSDSIIYKDIEHGEAVKIDEYDNYYDLDYVLNISITVKADWLGIKNIYTISEKGGIKDMELMWDDYKEGKGVTIEDVE